MTTLTSKAKIFSSLGKYLKSDQNWETMMKMRIACNEDYHWTDLTNWEDKIAGKIKMREKGIPFIPSRFHFYQPWNSSALKFAIEEAAERRPVIVKPSHLHSGDGVFLVSGAGVSIPRSTRSEETRRRMEKRRGRRRRLDVDDVVKDLDEAMERNAGPSASRALRESIPGVVAEDLIRHDAKVGILVVGGKALIGATSSAWTMVRKCPQSPNFSGGWKKHGIHSEEDWILDEGHWGQMVDWAETLADETDLLRVDFFVSRRGSCLASSMRTFLRPESRLFYRFHPALAKNLLAHHHTIRWSVDQRFA